MWSLWADPTTYKYIKSRNNGGKNMYEEMKGKVAVVTGGTSGLGLGISEAFLREGVSVFALYKQDDKKAKQAEHRLADLGSYTAVKVDVSNEEQVNAFFSKLKQVDYLVNCAGVSHEDEIIKLSMTQIRDVFETQIIGKIIMCKGAIPLTASEAGIVMFTKNLALEWAEYGIRVNCVSPSLTVNTGSFYEFYTDEDAEKVGKSNPSGRLGKPVDTANAVLFLCSSAADYITGENLNVNGGILLI